jgi:hypothetical protein
VQELGGSNFTKAVIAEFRRGYSDDWWKRFWETLLAEAKGMAKNVARMLGIPASSVTRKHDVGVTVLIGYLIQSGKNWRDLEFAPLPEREAVGIKCYTEAVSYAQAQFDRVFNGKKETANSQPTLEEFEMLLWLYQEDEWFDRRVEEVGMETKDRIASEQFRNEIASRVLQRALARLSQHHTDRGPKRGRTPALNAKSNGKESRLQLEQLQSKWGPGWMLAIHSVPYRWEV